MNKTIKVYTIGGGSHCAEFLKQSKPIEIVKDIGVSDLVILPGGADIYPAYYNHETGKNTSFNLKRDEVEYAEIRYAIQNGKLLLGICRGAQWLCIHAGGTLIQHVENHGREHDILLINENRKIRMSSLHHQMMNLSGIDPMKYKILARTVENLSNTYLNGVNMEIELPSDFVEPEIVYFNSIRGLAVQGHPEFMDKNSAAVKYVNLLIDELLEDDSYKYLQKKQVAGTIQNNPRPRAAVRNGIGVLDNSIRSAEAERMNQAQQQANVINLDADMSNNIIWFTASNNTRIQTNTNE